MGLGPGKIILPITLWGLIDKLPMVLLFFSKIFMRLMMRATYSLAALSLEAAAPQRIFAIQEPLLKLTLSLETDEQSTP